MLQAITNGRQHGFDIMEATDLPSGTVYPALRRLEYERLVRSKWERAELAQREGRPPRRYYELTPAGEEWLDKARERYRRLAALAPGPSRRLKPARSES